MEDVLKFGTIAFFLISGFLLGDQFETSDAKDYLRRRLKKVFVPWLFWFYLQVAYFTAANMYEHGLRLTMSVATLRVLGGIVTVCMTSSTFWFVPNLFVAVSVLMIFRRYLHALWLGAILFAMNLFYVVNIYTEWIPSAHTMALFGFVFYVWLGSYAARHYARISAAVAGVPASVLAGAVVVSGLLSLAETSVLMRMHFGDPVNTMRLSNQVFSVAVVLLLSRLRTATWPSFIDVRRQMYGVYLSQWLILGMVESGLKRAVPRIPGLNQMHGNLGLLLMWVAVVPVVFLVCLTISQTLAKHRKTGWMVGDLSLHRAERRTAEGIRQRAAALRAQAAAREGEDSGRELGAPKLA